jgi:alpha-galactosidase
MVRFPLLLLGVVSSISAYNTPTPFYGATASGKTAPPRGWNSFVLQSNGPGAVEAGFQFNVANFDTQCGVYYGRVQENFDYYCSIDSGWSVGGNGDDNGRFIPDNNVWNTQSIQDFAAKLHSNNMKLGLYVIPGAFDQDSQKLVEGTDISIGSLFNYTVDGRPGISNAYNARHNFDYTKDGVQQWHDSIVKLFDSW